MSEILELYTSLRNKDKKRIKTYPIDNRIILSKLITNKNADSELKYVWINRAVSQVSDNKTSAILGLDNLDLRSQKISRRMTLKLRKIKGLNVPFEINNSNDFNNFMDNNKQDFIIIKQNYPNYSNEEISELKNYNFRNKKVIYANSEEGNKIIGANECLEKLYIKDRDWIKKNIEKYLKYFYKKNNLVQSEEAISEKLNIMLKLVEALLIPCELYKGEIKGLRMKIKELLKKGFLPVFKFSDSISGYGVHYPKSKNGEYNLNEIKEVIKKDTKLQRYLVEALNKNGQKIDDKYIETMKKTTNLVKKVNTFINKNNMFRNDDIDYKVGDHVSHTDYGIGVVVAVDKSIMTVAFPHPVGVKKLMKKHKSISKVEV